MLVGDVRWATTGAGSSWKLSGGSSCSCAVTNVSKKCHARRAVSRRARASASEIGEVPAPRTGRLAHRATAGESIHRIRNGAAIGHDPAPEAFVPARHRELRGDRGRTALVPLFDDLQEITAVLVGKNGEAEVVENQQPGSR